MGRVHDEDARRSAAARAATRISKMNFERDDQFQDTAMGEIRLALEAFRPDREAELPGPGDDPLLDALTDLARALDASPETVNAACARVIEMAGATSAATTEAPAASAH